MFILTAIFWWAAVCLFCFGAAVLCVVWDARVVWTVCIHEASNYIVMHGTWLSGRTLAVQTRCPEFDSWWLPTFSVSSISPQNISKSLYLI